MTRARAALEPDEASPSARRWRRPASDGSRTRRFHRRDRPRGRGGRAGAGRSVPRPTRRLEALAGSRDSQFRGEPLEGLDLPACFRYHEWYVGEREQLRGCAGCSARRARRAARRRGSPGRRPGGGVALGPRARRVDPLTEACHVDVVRILGRLGRAREALAQIQMPAGASCSRARRARVGCAGAGAARSGRAVIGAASTSPAPLAHRWSQGPLARAVPSPDARRQPPPSTTPARLLRSGGPRAQTTQPRRETERRWSDGTRPRRHRGGGGDRLAAGVGRPCCSSAIRASARPAFSIWSPTRCGRRRRRLAGARSKPRWSAPTARGATRWPVPAAR